MPENIFVLQLLVRALCGTDKVYSSFIPFKLFSYGEIREFEVVVEKSVKYTVNVHFLIHS